MQPKNLFTWAEWIKLNPDFQNRLLSESLPYCESNSPEWLANRIKGIGGSDVGAILGVNKYKDSFTVYQEKVNGYKTDFSNNYAIERGNALEPLLLRWFAKQNPELSIIIKVPTQYDIKKPHRRVNVDGIAINSAGEIIILECKSAEFNAFMSWKNDIPESYKAQIHWGMGIIGTNKAIMILDAGGAYMQFNANYNSSHFLDEQEYEGTFKTCDEFWYENIEKKIEPKPTSLAIDIINKRVKSTEKILEVDDKELLRAVQEYNGYRADENHSKANKEDLKAYIANILTHLECDTCIIGNFKVSYKNVSKFNQKKFVEENPLMADKCKEFKPAMLKKLDKKIYAEYSEKTGRPKIDVKEL